MVTAMQEIRRDTNNQAYTPFLSSFGYAVRLFFSSFAPGSVRQLNSEDLRFHLSWMGLAAVPLITFSAVLIGIALCTQTVLELQRYSAQELAGSVISIGLLRELAALTVSMYWGSRAAVMIAQLFGSEESNSEISASQCFCLLLAALISGFALAGYGLVVSMAAAAIYSPLLGVSSASNFIEIARQTIQLTDAAMFFLKAVIVVPIIAVMVGCASCRDRSAAGYVRAGNAVSIACVSIAVANLAITQAFSFR